MRPLAAVEGQAASDDDIGFDVFDIDFDDLEMNNVDDIDFDAVDKVIADASADAARVQVQNLVLFQPSEQHQALVSRQSEQRQAVVSRPDAQRQALVSRTSEQRQTTVAAALPAALPAPAARQARIRRDTGEQAQWQPIFRSKHNAAAQPSKLASQLTKPAASMSQRQPVAIAMTASLPGFQPARTAAPPARRPPQGALLSAAPAAGTDLWCSGELVRHAPPPHTEPTPLAWIEDQAYDGGRRARPPSPPHHSASLGWPAAAAAQKPPPSVSRGNGRGGAGATSQIAAKRGWAAAAAVQEPVQRGWPVVASRGENTQHAWPQDTSRENTQHARASAPSQATVEVRGLQGPPQDLDALLADFLV